jgi:purine-cytosine permease-like protein
VFRKKRADEQEATFCSMLPFFCLIGFVVVMVVGIVYEEWHVVKRFYRKMEEWEESIL